MSRILVAGATGYAGSALVHEAASRGHQVVGVSRNAPESPVDGVHYVQGAAPDAVLPLAAEQDVVVATLSPRGDMAGRLVETYRAIAEAAASAGARLLVVGGFSSLRPAEGADRFIEHAEPSEYLAEAQEMNSVLLWLEASAPEGLDWLFASPGMGFSSWNPGTRTGRYRIGGPVSLAGEADSNVSGTDFALALVDEIEKAEHSGHIGVTY